MSIYKSRWDGNPPDLVVTIDDWKADNNNVAEILAAMSSAGAFPLEPTETFQRRPFMTDDTSSAAALVTLDVGVYTVQASSADDWLGEVLVEVYEITESEGNDSWIGLIYGFVSTAGVRVINFAFL